MTAPPVQWVTASPLWQDAMAEPARLRRPAILRFASDRFMDELSGTLATDPADLTTRVAAPVSYRQRPPGVPATWDPAPTELKLFQPIHGHFNLISASLVCRIPGMPDRLLDAADDEAVGFVLRRLVPMPASGATATVGSGSGASKLGTGGSSIDGQAADAPDAQVEDARLVEHAWIADPLAGPGWQPVGTSAARLVANEELLPLFPLQFQDGGRRRLFVGLIPTGSVETFKATGTLSPAATTPDGSPVDGRPDEFDTQVIAPLAELVRTKAAVDKGTVPQAAKVAASNLRQEASEFLLLDFADLLRIHMPTLWTAVRAAQRPASGAGPQALYDALTAARASSAPNARTIRALLVEAADKALRIADEGGSAAAMGVDLADAVGLRDAGGLPAEPTFTALRATIRGALPEPPAATTEPPRADAAAAGNVPKLAGRRARFVVRCVFRRPRCLPLPLDIVSDPTEPFTIAPFFDPDAPARTVRVELPVKTTIAELRKYPKSVGFAISNQLREQMSRVTDLKKTMDGELGAGESLDLGMLCSFSIPIITICALIVLLIFVGLLNLVFWWMPFLRICLPIALPGKRA